MITSIVILSVSLALLAYWFRYSCLLILSAKTARDYAAVVARENRLSFLDVQSALEAHEDPATLDRLQQVLEKDYRTLSSLTYFGFLFSSNTTLETVLLCADYHLMRAWYAAARVLWPAEARGAVAEMTEIIRYLANCHGANAEVSKV